MARGARMFRRKPAESPDVFWREYEEKTNEKVLGQGLGCYISGWEEFESREWKNIWGLVIASSGGFRFHNFPKQNRILSLSLDSSPGGSKDKTIFIPKEKIISVKLYEETRWWIRIFKYAPPELVIKYLDAAGNEKQLLLEADYRIHDVAEKLKEMQSSG